MNSLILVSCLTQGYIWDAWHHKQFRHTSVCVKGQANIGATLWLSFCFVIVVINIAEPTMLSSSKFFSTARFQRLYNDSIEQQSVYARKHRTLKSILLRFAGILAVMYLIFSGARAIVRPSFGGRLWAACHGTQRNMSSVNITLPTHYQLPSGDKIPAVALGIATLWFRQLSISLMLMQHHSRCLASWERRSRFCS